MFTGHFVPLLDLKNDDPAQGVVLWSVRPCERLAAQVDENGWVRVKVPGARPPETRFLPPGLITTIQVNGIDRIGGMANEAAQGFAAKDLSAAVTQNDIVRLYHRNPCNHIYTKADFLRDDEPAAAGQAEQGAAPAEVPAGFAPAPVAQPLQEQQQQQQQAAHEGVCDENHALPGPPAQQQAPEQDAGVSRVRTGNLSLRQRIVSKIGCVSSCGAQNAGTR